MTVCHKPKLRCLQLFRLSRATRYIIKYFKSFDCATWMFCCTAHVFCNQLRKYLLPGYPGPYSKIPGPQSRRTDLISFGPYYVTLGLVFFIIASLKFLYGQSVRFPASFPCLSFPVPFLYIDCTKAVLTGLKAY